MGLMDVSLASRSIANSGHPVARSSEGDDVAQSSFYFVCFSIVNDRDHLGNLDSKKNGCGSERNDTEPLSGKVSRGSFFETWREWRSEV